MTNLQITNEIDKDEFLLLSQNGARTLFEFQNYLFLDGVRADVKTHFLRDGTANRLYIVSPETAYECVTMYYCGGSRTYLWDCILSMIESFDENKITSDENELALQYMINRSFEIYGTISQAWISKDEAGYKVCCLYENGKKHATWLATFDKEEALLRIKKELSSESDEE